MRVGIVRHGESEGNLTSTLQGCRIDTGLSLRGRRQAEALSIRLASEEIDVVVVSPMIRARQTACTLAAPHGVAIRIDADLAEFDWGDWTGRSLDDDLERQVGELRARWRSGDVNLASPGGESPSMAAERAGRALSRLRDSGAKGPLVVAHGRFNRVLMAVLLRRDLSRMDEIRQRNGSYSLFEWDGVSGATPLLLDSIDHLGGHLSESGGRSDSLR